MSKSKETISPTQEETPGQSDTETLSPRIRLIRDAAILQFKLMVDGIRDAMLIPVSLIAALVGFLRGGDQPDLEFQRVLELGRRSERWINLFGRKEQLPEEVAAGSMDQILQQAQAVVVEQYKKGRPPPEGKSTGDDEEQDSPDKPGV